MRSIDPFSDKIRIGNPSHHSRISVARLSLDCRSIVARLWTIQMREWVPQRLSPTPCGAAGATKGLAFVFFIFISVT